jgi:hypothetical protein
MTESAEAKSGFEAFTAATMKMWRRVGLVKTGFSDECVASIFRVEQFSGEEKR